jgi:hypothetical protein
MEEFEPGHCEMDAPVPARAWLGGRDYVRHQPGD